MNSMVRDGLGAVRDGNVGAIRRRHLIYISGYDPRGPQGYFDLFQRTCERFRKLWPVSLALDRIETDSDDFAHWRVDVRGSGWEVATQYDFLRLERFIRSDMNRATAAQVLRALGWYAGDLVTGAQFRIARASWRFALHLLYFQLLVVCWIALAAGFGAAIGFATTAYPGLPVRWAVAVSLLAAGVALYALRPLAGRWRVIQICSCWSTLRRFGRGRSSWLDRAVDAGARRVVAVARASAVDELVIVGHSTGGVIASAIAARALELDPDLGRFGPRLALLTLGSVMPAVALHPAAKRVRAIVQQLALAQQIDWIDCQSRKDVMCFANFDPVGGIGVDAGPQRRNPLLWRISFKDMFALEDYDRFRWNHFRVHYQYILAGDRPAPYDFLWLVAGPMAIAEWPKRHEELMEAFREKSLAMNVATAKS